jgi:hypothetical protein
LRHSADIEEIKPYDSRKKSTTIETVKHAALVLTAAWILWNHTTNPDSSQETWTPLSQFKTKSGCVEAAQGIVKKHISTPRTIEGSALISPNHQPQKLLVYIGDNLVAAISYECAPSTQNPRLVSPSP